MPSMITPPVMPQGGSQAVSQGGTRGRGADEAQGQGFSAALERSRAGSNSQRTPSQDNASGVATAERKPVRKPGADDDTKDALPAAPDLAFLATAHTPLHALTLAGRAAAQGGGALGAADGAAAAAAGTDIPVDAAAIDPLAKGPLPAPDAAALAANAKAAPDTEAAGKDAAKPAAATAAASAADAPRDAGAAPASLQDIVRAAVAAQAMNVGTAKPGATPASPAAGGAAAGRAGPRAAVSATTAEQLASAAQPKAGEDTRGAAAAVAAVAAPLNAANTDALADTGADAQPGATPFALQQASAATASAARTEEAAAARPSAHAIAPEVGSDKWGPALGQQLARMSTTGHHTAELSLNPAGLGPLKVTLSLGDNQAQAMFVSAHESVRKAVEAALPQLRTALSEQGITLGQASVGADTRQAGGQDAAFAQQQQQQQNARQATAGYPGTGRAAAAQVAPVAVARPGPAAHAGAGVDTFA